MYLSYYYPSQDEWYDVPAYYAPMGYYGLPCYEEEDLGEEELQINDEYLVIEW